MCFKKDKHDVYILNVPRKKDDIQIYMQSFCEAWLAYGGTKYLTISKRYNYRLFRHLAKTIAHFRLFRSTHNNRIIVCSRGGHLLKSALPCIRKGEIVPMLWDCWPITWKKLEKDLRLLQCRLCFVNSSNVVRYFSEKMPDIRFEYVPEGVDINDYDEGLQLSERSTDVYEVGRRHNYYHQRLIQGNLSERLSFIYNPSEHNTVKYPRFISFDEFTRNLADCRIAISFPNSMTNPKEYGHLEILTMRYWEQMLSRCVIVGHCPQELIDILGYNPVIEADFAEPCQQLYSILDHIDYYQPLVDKNRQNALQFGSWASRMPRIKDILYKQ